MPYTIPSYTVSPGSFYQPKGGLPSIIKTDGRAAYFTRGGSIASGRVLDQLPSNNGTRRTGEEGRCYLYDGTDDYSDITGLGDDLLNSSFSVSFWFNKTDATSDNDRFLDYSIDANNTLQLTTDQTSQKYAVKMVIGGSTKVDAFYDALDFGAWHQLTFTWDGNSNFKAYLDAVEMTAGSTTPIGYGAAGKSIGRRNDNSSTTFFEGKIFDFRIYNKALTQDEVNFIYSFGETGTDPDLPVNWWKCDEQSGTVGYDSVGGNHLTHTNITAATFHATQGIWSFQNQVGYNTSGAVYIPRDESDPTNDVLGNPLTNIGRRPNDAKLTGSNCLTADGTLRITSTHITGTETVVSSGGTSTPSISAGRIDFTAGTCWNLTLSDGTHYKLAEGYGTTILDASGNGNHGELTSATLASAWGATQDDYHSNLIDGSGKRMRFDGVDDYVNFGSVGNLGVNCKVQFDFLTRESSQILFSQRDANRSCVLYQLSASNSIAFYNANGNIAIWTGTPNGINIRDGNKHTLVFEKNGNDLSITIDGYTLSVTKAFADSGNTGDFAVGGHPNETAEFTGLISNVKVDAGNTGVWDLESNGYGNTDADWTDQIGSNNGTINGSPEAFYIPAGPDGLDVFGDELTEKPSDAARNRAETTIDFNPDSTPEMGATQLGITVPSAHGFGDTLAASDQIFSRQRTLTEDRFVVMPEAQTGSALATIQKYTQP